MFRMNKLGARTSMKCCGASKVIGIDVINDVRKLYLGGALLQALFSKICFLTNMFFRKTSIVIN